MNDHAWLIPELTSLAAYAEKAGLPEVAEILSGTTEQITPMLAPRESAARPLRKRSLRVI